MEAIAAVSDLKRLLPRLKNNKTIEMISMNKEMLMSNYACNHNLLNNSDLV